MPKLIKTAQEHSALTLLVTRILADDAYHALTADDLAIAADALD
jgi:hypothetical protein